MTRAPFVGGYGGICEGRILRQKVCCPTCEYLRYFKIDFLVIADRIIKQDRQRTENVTLRRVLTAIVAVSKAINVTYSECALVALGIQHARACAILSSVVCPDVQNFSTLCHKRHDFYKKKSANGHKMCVSIFSTTSV